MADFLYDLITRYGVAEIVMSDQGREFVNRVKEELFQLCGTDHRISSAYHPQSNGLDERLNQTLTRALVKFVNDNQHDGMCTSSPFCSPIELVKMIPPNSHRSS